jgi:hypothetical protein
MDEAWYANGKPTVNGGRVMSTSPASAPPHPPRTAVLSPTPPYVLPALRVARALKSRCL